MTDTNLILKIDRLLKVKDPTFNNVTMAFDLYPDFLKDATLTSFMSKESFSQLQAYYCHRFSGMDRIRAMADFFSAIETSNAWHYEFLYDVRHLLWSTYAHLPSNAIVERGISFDSFSGDFIDYWYSTSLLISSMMNTTIDKISSVVDFVFREKTAQGTTANMDFIHVEHSGFLIAVLLFQHQKKPTMLGHFLENHEECAQYLTTVKNLEIIKDDIVTLENLYEILQESSPIMEITLL